MIIFRIFILNNLTEVTEEASRHSRMRSILLTLLEGREEL